MTLTSAVCEDCGDAYDPDEGCQHDGHHFCPCCLTNCGECGQQIRDDHAAEVAMAGEWS